MKRSAGRIRILASPLAVLLPALAAGPLAAQESALSPNQWQGVNAVVLRLRDVSVVVNAFANARLALSDLSPTHEWTQEVVQGQLVVEALPRPGPRTGASVLDVTVPPEVEVQIFTSTGTVVVTGCRNLRVVRSLRGDIRLSDTRGELRAETLTGAIDIRNHLGDFYLQTSTGKVRFVGARPVRQSQILTASGDIVLQLMGPIDSIQLTASTLGPLFRVFGQTVKDRIRQGTGPILVTVASGTGRIEVNGP